MCREGNEDYVARGVKTLIGDAQKGTTAVRAPGDKG